MGKRKAQGARRKAQGAGLLTCKNRILNKELPYYTTAQLALRNGNDRQEVWVSYKGYIYEVTGSRLWRGGKHYQHWAGQDLTHEFPDAPHTDRVFDKFKVIGKLLTNDSDR